MRDLNPRPPALKQVLYRTELMRRLPFVQARFYHGELRDVPFDD